MTWSARARRVALAGTFVLVTISCNRTPDALPLVAIEEATFAPALGVDLRASRRTPGGTYLRDIRVGEGAEVRAGQRVSVHYRGTLADGTEFDANQPGDQPYTFPLGQGRVIAGWDEGVAGMRVGGERQLVIPASMGYGERGTGPIPGNAILVFTVTLVRAE
jgi:FKBP-type peptidyl-prolyl cis-trans isomerase FkpA